MTSSPERATDDRRSIGTSESALEDALDEAFTRQVVEGTQRLSRSWREVLVTGFFGGSEVAFGVLAMIFVIQETGSHLLGGLAFSVGFIALLIGRADLFTEGFHPGRHRGCEARHRAAARQALTDEMPAKIVAAMIGGFLLAGTGMFHSILDSLLIFGAIHTGDASFGYTEWLQFFAVAVVGNIAGGLGLVTLLRLVRSKERLLDERHGRRNAS